MKPTRPSLSSFSSALATAAAAALLLTTNACGAPQTKSEVALSKLPVWEGKDAKLFDDTIEPAAFGLAMDRPHFKGDARFRERAQAAESMALMKITTVTIGKIDDRSTYHLQLDRQGDVIGGKDEPSFEIDVKEGSPGFAVAAQVQARARGKTVVAMWKHYRAGDESVIHYYLAPDDPETVNAAKEAMALQEVSR